MIAVISPAKKIVLQKGYGPVYSKPYFMDDAVQIANVLKMYSPWKLETLLKTSPKLAVEAFEYYQDFSELREGRQALLSYNGTAFSHINVWDFSMEEFLFAEEHLRILSAMYGILRPSDTILPHRLDFNSAVRIDGKNLYWFWGSRVYERLFKGREVVVNLASGEYAKLLKPHLLPVDQMVTCEFISVKKGRKMTIATTAKAARGEMSRFMVKNKLTKPQQLQVFEWNGFQYSKENSSATSYVFLQNENASWQ